MYMSHDTDGVLKSFHWLWGGQKVISSRDNLNRSYEVASTRMNRRTDKGIRTRRTKPMETL